MPPRRRIAFLTLPEGIDLRQRLILSGITRYARERGDWQVALDPYADRPGPSPYHGVISTTRKGRGPRLAGLPIPVVLVNWGHIHQPQLVRVVENRYAAGRMAARHLAEQGCRTFAYVGFGKQRQSWLEQQDFHLELRRRGLHIHRARTFVTYASSRGWWNKVMRSLDEWLGRLKPPAGIFVARPDLARAIADLALARDIRIPQDIALVAADDDPILCEVAPALSAIRFDYAELGRRAAATLDHLIDGGRPPDRNILSEPTLVPRYSTDRQALGDPVVADALWFIDSHRTEPIRPREVAAGIGVSYRTLSDRMRRARGRTLRDEITLARIEHARLQLEHSNSPIAAVAAESGFGSYETMLRAFRRHLGRPPIAFRQMDGWVSG